MDFSIWLEPFMASIRSPFLVGFIICALFSAVPSPMNMLVIEQTLEKGAHAGVGVGLAVALGGMGALFIAALPWIFGITLVTDWLQANIMLVGSVLAAILLVIGAYMIAATPKTAERNAPPKLGYVVGAFTVTALQPGNVLFNVAIITSMKSLGLITNNWHMLSLFASYAIGSMVVFLTYIYLARRIRTKLNTNTMKRVNTAIGGLIMLFGLGSLLFMANL